MMSSRRFMVDEFESVFQSSLRPTLDIKPLQLSKLLVVLDTEGCEEKRQAVVSVAADLADRHRLEVRIITPVAPHRVEQAHLEARAQEATQDCLTRIRETGVKELSSLVRVASPHRAILDEVESWDPSLLIMSSLFGEVDEDLESYTLGSVTDRVLSSIHQPILLIEGKVDDVSRMWSDILVYVEERVTAEQCLACTRSVALKDAHTSLLHVIDKEWMDQIQRAINLASRLPSTETGEAILRSLRSDMNRYLESARDLLNSTGHQADFSIELGDPIEVCREKVRSGGHGLLICNSVSPDRKLIDSLAYNLAAYLREIPLLLV